MDHIKENDMNRSLLSLVLAMFPVSLVAASPPQDLIYLLEHPRYQSDALEMDNRISRYSRHDFSALLMPSQPFLGYIGNGFRRLDMYFTSVSKSPDEANVYLVKGISLVGTNKCDFHGTVRIEQIREYRSFHYGLDDMYKGAIAAEGVLIGSYRFEESAKQRHSGIFEGTMASNWLLDKNGIMRADHTRWYSDNYRNNQYVGTWTGYGKNERKVANWGESRIPFSGDLDVGAGDFSPNTKYLDKGWSEPRLP